jgi:hypothetical protein
VSDLSVFAVFIEIALSVEIRYKESTASRYVFTLLYMQYQLRELLNKDEGQGVILYFVIGQ